MTQCHSSDRKLCHITHGRHLAIEMCKYSWVRRNMIGLLIACETNCDVSADRQETGGLTEFRSQWKLTEAQSGSCCLPENNF